MNRLTLPKWTFFLRAPWILALLLLVTVTFLLTGTADTLFAPVMARNQAYLDASIKDTACLMIPVAAAKAAADAVEGSTINIEAGAVFAKAGMNIEAGDTMQPLLDYINIAWRLLLISLIYLVSAKCILAGADAIAFPLLIIALTALLAERLFAATGCQGRVLQQIFHRIGALFLLCALLFLVIVPLTVTGTAYLSHRTTDPMRQEVSASFDKIGAVFSLDKFHQTNDLKDKAAVLKEKILELSDYAKDSISEVGVAVCKLAAVKLLNGIIFPLASFVFLAWLVRGCLIPVLGLGEQSPAAHPPHPEKADPHSAA